MHYKNGREAKNGDKVLLIPSYGAPIVGILYDAVAGNDTCNGKIAATAPNDPMPNLQECLHIDDVIAVATKDLPITTAKPIPYEGFVAPRATGKGHGWTKRRRSRSD